MRLAYSGGTERTWSLPLSPPNAFAPARLGPVQLRNRVIKAATFEGMSPNNLVTNSLIEFHRKTAAGGVALSTVSYVAISPNGMGAPNEIYIHDRAADGLAKIADVVHSEGAAIGAAIGELRAAQFAGEVGDRPAAEAHLLSWSASTRA